ncbi:MAG: hypothetical protein ACI9YG_000567 [Candidatus Azotimanducaceae bacterium]
MKIRLEKKKHDKQEYPLSERYLFNFLHDFLPKRQWRVPDHRHQRLTLNVALPILPRETKSGLVGMLCMLCKSVPFSVCADARNP